MVRYLEILFRFKARFAVLLLVLPAVVGGTVILLYPSYKATGNLWVDNPGYYGTSQPTGWSQYETPAQNESDSLVQLLSTRAFARALYDQMARAIPDPAQRVQAVANAKVTIAPAGTHLISITTSCDAPQICVELANGAVTALRNLQIQTEQANAKAGADFVNAQLQQAQSTLAASQATLRTYVAQHPGAKVQTDPTTIADPQLAALATDVQKKQTQVDSLQSQLNSDNTAATATALIEASPRVIDPPQVVKAGRLGDGSSLKKAGIGALVALALGLGYLFVLGWADKTLRDPSEIENRFKVPVVTTIPELQPSERF